MKKVFLAAFALIVFSFSIFPIVPTYLDFDGKITRLGAANLTGNSTTSEFKVVLPQKTKRVLINYHPDVLATESISNGK